MILVDIEIQKDNKRLTYFPYILTGAFKGINKAFNNKKDLINYLKTENLKINQITHTNYNLVCNQLPF